MPAGTRNHSISRCSDCRLRQVLCICALLPKIHDAQTRVIVVMHHLEEKLPTNTARLAVACLSQAEIRVRGRTDRPLSTEHFNENAYLLYPAEDAEVLGEEWVRARQGKSVTLVVPDGSWRQAAKASRREPALKDLKTVKLPPGPPSEYLLRKEPHPHSVSTFEAIARALGVLEGERGPGIQSQLESIFRVMVDRTLWARGKLPAEKVRGGIPEQAFKDFYEAGVRGGELSRLLVKPVT